MPQAVVDPDELRRFAQSLKRFSTGLDQQMLSLHAQLKALEDTWRDTEHRKFTEEFEVTMRSIASFVEAAEQHVPFLLRKAERVEEYLRQR